MSDEVLVGDGARTLSLHTSRARQTGAYLLVVEQGTSSMVPLPVAGVLTIGRAPEADVRVDHASVSRLHARLVIGHDGVLALTDLGSHNGTLVNGRPLRGGAVLTTGDVVAIGEVILVIHAYLGSAMSPVLLDEASWNRSAQIEVQRAATYRRPLTVLVLAGASDDTVGSLREIDIVGRGDGELHVLLPEIDGAAARQLATTLLAAIAEHSPSARAGLATFPVDATDAGGLLQVARAAVRTAAPGAIGTASDTAKRVELGSRAVIICHPSVASVYSLLERLAASMLPVLVLGETGVGKEDAAFAVHHYSPRRAQPFVAINCATLHESLVESQLFGHDKGAFTGASSARAGVFEAATGGTLFLDEIGELPAAVQAKLLRVLETKKVTRIGETRERDVDVRIVAATNRTLETEVAAGRFREDLYYRLGSARVHLPPLRDRRCDIPILFRYFLAELSREKGVAPEPSPEVSRRLLEHGWPGNVRELRHVAAFAAATTDDDRIELEDLPPALAAPVVAPAAPPVIEQSPASPMRRVADELEELERRRIVEALERTGGVKMRAAALIGMPIRTFTTKLKQYGL